jgi:type IV secretory pathway component VirB8
MPDLLHRGLAVLRPHCRSCSKLADAYWGATSLCAEHWLEAHDWLEQHQREARERSDEVWARIVVLMLLVAAATFVLAVLW